MGCTNVLTDKHLETLEKAARGEFCELDPEMMKKVMPEVRRAIDERFEEMMEEKNANFVEKAQEIIDKGESSFPDIDPGERQLMDEIAEQELKNLRPVKTMPEERKTMREAGEELRLSPARYVGTADIVRFPKESVKEVMAILNHPEMPRCFTRRDIIGQVQYVNRPELEEITRVKGLHQELVHKEQDKIIHAIYILPENSKCPSGKLLQGRIVHEVTHANWARFEEYQKEHQREFARALASQSVKGPPSKYSYSDNRKEWMAECYRYYITDKSKLSPEMTDFLRNFSEYFSNY